MSKVILEIDTYLLDVIARTCKMSDKEVLFIFNDKARVLAEHISRDEFKSNWSSTTLIMTGFPAKIKLKAKYTGYPEKKVGDIRCTFTVGKGRHILYDSQQLFDEMIETTLLKGKS